MQHIRIGEWLAVIDENKIIKESCTINLKPQVMNLLVFMALNPSTVLSTEKLLNALWPGRVVSDSSVYQSIAQLRKALGNRVGEEKYISTIPKKGYKLNASVEILDIKEQKERENQPNSPPPKKLPPAKVNKKHLRTKLKKQKTQILYFIIFSLIVISCILSFKLHAEKPALLILAITPIHRPDAEDPSYKTLDFASESLVNSFANLKKMQVINFRLCNELQLKNNCKVRNQELSRYDYILSLSVNVKTQWEFDMRLDLIDSNTDFQIWSKYYQVDKNNHEYVNNEILQNVFKLLVKDQPIPDFPKYNDALRAYYNFPPAESQAIKKAFMERKKEYLGG